MVASTASRVLTGDRPAQGDRLVGAQVVTGEGNDDVVSFVVPDQFFGGGVLRTVFMFLDGRATDQIAGVAVPQVDREVTRVAGDRLPPVQSVLEPAALADVADRGGLAGLDRG